MAERHRHRANVSGTVMRKRPIWKIVFIATVFALVAAPTLLVASWEVLHGNGAATYTNVYGLVIHWTSVLVLVIALVSTLLVAFVARLIIVWRDKRATMALIRQIVARAASGNDH
jgi:hypothetical protein